MEKKTTVPEKQTPKKKGSESVYTVQELVDNAESVFGAGTKRECVSAAFRFAGKTQVTREEAKKIFENFMKKEVK
jgi:hypothetical protein|nr:MAG TPA: hypothetical protein [Caudoviricetes sp.]